MPSIQRVLASIQLDQVCRYLADTGWQQSLNGSRVDFEKRDDSAEEPCRVFLPASSTHPRFRQLLPNLVFSVSIVEDREPIQIAMDIASLQIAPPSHSDPAPLLRTELGTWQLRNSTADSVEVELGDVGEHYRLTVGEELLVVANGSPAPVVELLSAAAVRVHGARVVLAVPSQAGRPVK